MLERVHNDSERLKPTHTYPAVFGDCDLLWCFVYELRHVAGGILMYPVAQCYRSPPPHWNCQRLVLKWQTKKKKQWSEEKQFTWEIANKYNRTNIVKPKPARQRQRQHNHNQTYEKYFFRPTPKRNSKHMRTMPSAIFTRAFFAFCSRLQMNGMVFRSHLFFPRFIRVVSEFVFNKWKQRREKKNYGQQQCQRSC